MTDFKNILDGLDSMISEYDEAIKFFESYKVGGGHSITPLMNDRIEDTKKFQRRLNQIKELIKDKQEEHSFEIKSIYDNCPICKEYSFIMHTRTQAVHHIVDCLKKHELSKKLFSMDLSGLTPRYVYDTYPWDKFNKKD